MSICIRKDTLPWYQLSEEEEDHRFSEEALLMYVLLAFSRDHFNEFNGSLKDLLDRLPGQIHYTRDIVIEYYGAIVEIMERPPEYGDALIIRPAGRKQRYNSDGELEYYWDAAAARRTPRSYDITPAKRLNLDMSARRIDDGVPYITLESWELLSLLKGTTPKTVKSCFNLLLYLHAQMYPVDYKQVVEGGEVISATGFGCWHRQKLICEALGIDDNTVRRHIQTLMKSGNIRYKPGGYGHDSLFTIGDNDYLFMAVEQRQEKYQRYSYGSIRGKYRDATKQIQWRNKVYASASRKT